jgi:hypothetical protein
VWWQTSLPARAAGGFGGVAGAGLAALATVLIMLPGRAEDAPTSRVSGSQQPTPVDDLQVRYAVARLKLAELDLERALAANGRVAGAIGEREIGRLRNHLQLMQRQVQIARRRPRTSANETNLAAAELARENAREDLEAALGVARRSPDAVADVDIRRLRTKLEITEIRLELFRNPSYVPSPIDEMMWHIDQLTEQMIDLRHRVETRSTADTGTME